MWDVRKVLRSRLLLSSGGNGKQQRREGEEDEEEECSSHVGESTDADELVH